MMIIPLLLLLLLTSVLGGFHTTQMLTRRQRSLEIDGTIKKCIDGNNGAWGTRRSRGASVLRESGVMDPPTNKPLENSSDASNKKKKNAKTVTLVTTLDEYKKEVAEVDDRIVVVRFFAPWCKACRAVESSFYKLARESPDVKFVEVPATKDNITLHQGLGIRAIPFAHIYFPSSGLVEELSINRTHFTKFEQVLGWYREGKCDIIIDDMIDDMIDEMSG